MSNTLPTGITIRPAVREDDRVLRAMIRREHLETAEKVTLNEVKGLKTQAKMLHFVP